MMRPFNYNNAGMNEALAALLKEPEKLPLLATLETLTKIAGNSSVSTSNRHAASFLMVVGMLSLFSSVTFFTSAFDAGERYSTYTKNYPYISWIFNQWFLGASAVLTNSFFNWAAFCKMGRGQVSFMSWLTAGLLAWKENPARQIVALCGGAGSIVPFWYLSLTDDELWNIVVSASAAINIPVFYSGTDLCYEVLCYPEVTWVWLQPLRLATYYSNEALEQKNELIKIQLLLVNHFLDLADDFRKANTDQKNSYIASFLNAEGKLENLLQMKDDAGYFPAHTNIIRKNNCLLIMKCVWSLLGVWQNFGHVVEAYRAGAQWHFALGIFFALCNLGPDIGYTISGVLGFGLLELLIELFLCQKSTSQDSARFSIYFFVLMIVMRLSYAFSGFSGDQVNYDAATFCGLNVTVAFVMGLLSNFGTAFVFNGPQCELLLQNVFRAEPVTVNDEQLADFQAELDSLPVICRTLTPDDIEELRSDEKTGAALFCFFQSKGFNTTVSTVETRLLNQA
ncbi:MAG: hypothetical protein KBD83_06355 [Gammaproteobacteria bacterium]|nr:hypothetical protein [Gammaproteobacteria bacterium]